MTADCTTTSVPRLSVIRRSAALAVAATSSQTGSSRTRAALRRTIADPSRITPVTDTPRLKNPQIIRLNRRVTLGNDFSSPMDPVALLVFLMCTLSALAGVRQGIQAPPVFAGHWVLTSITPQRPGYEQFWFGTEARVTQTETTLVITRVSPPQREARFTFNAESHNEYGVDGQKIVRESRAT